MKTLVFLLLLSQSSAFCAERPEDFAYGMPIHVDARDALYELEIPAAEFKVRTASLGEQVTLAGAARLRAQTDYKKWTLWGILILGVFVLAAMAYRLARQVKTTPADETDNSK
jgi:hypothetical protein